MGIRTDTSSKIGTIFSEDILKIEIYGPNEDYLTVIDVPGIFRNSTEGITTKKDIALVNDLVRKYIKDRRTIILAVLPSNVDIATQEILALAEQFDPVGERTLGVLTKPDLVTEFNAKNSVCNLVYGNRKPLSLGYYIVRNRGADHKHTVDQDTLEEMFQQEPWSSLPSERVGIRALRKQLETLLTQITRREFPNLRKEANEKLAECQRDLENLGPARPTEKEQRGYLSAIARHFQDLTRGALNAQYSHPPVFKNHETRLITRVVNLSAAFRHGFQIYGQLRNFKNIRSEPTTPVLEPESELECVPGEVCACPSVSSSSSLDFHRYLRQYLHEDGIITVDEYPELSSIIAEDVEIEEPQDGIMEWIRDLYLQSRGMDLCPFSSDLISAAFGEQSRQWEPMVRVYMGEVVRFIHHFMAKALRTVCADGDLTKEIWTAIIDPVLQRYKSGLDQAILLVDIERYQRPFTLNSTFNNEVQNARGIRMREMLRPKAWKKTKQYQEDQMLMYLDDVPRAAADQTSEQCSEEEIHDKLCSYYHLAVDRLMDNILRQAIGYNLLFGPMSPLNVFSQEWVIDLDTEELELIAGEKEATKRRRQKLTKKRKELKTALEILKT